MLASGILCILQIYTFFVLWSIYSLFCSMSLAYRMMLYYFNQNLYPFGFGFLVHCLELSAKVKKISCIIKSVRLFERFRDVASSETKSTYNYWVSLMEAFH